MLITLDHARGRRGVAPAGTARNTQQDTPASLTSHSCIMLYEMPAPPNQWPRALQRREGRWLHPLPASPNQQQRCSLRPHCCDPKQPAAARSGTRHITHHAPASCRRTVRPTATPCQQLTAAAAAALHTSRCWHTTGSAAATRSQLPPAQYMPMSGIGGAAFLSSGASTMTHSLVVIRLLTDAASTSAVRTTWAVGWRSSTRQEGSRQASAAEGRRGALSARQAPQRCKRARAAALEPSQAPQPASQAHEPQPRVSAPPPRTLSGSMMPALTMSV